MKRPSSASWGGPFVSYEVQAAAPTPPLPRRHTAHPSPKKFLSRLRGGEHPRERAAVTCGQPPYSSCPLSLFLSSLPKSPLYGSRRKAAGLQLFRTRARNKSFSARKRKNLTQKGTLFPADFQSKTRQHSPPYSAGFFSAQLCNGFGRI